MNREVSIGENVLNRHNNEKEEIKEIKEREEIVKMWKDMDEKLEMKAKSLNLTAINVKSILHVSFNFWHLKGWHHFLLN